MAGIEDGVSAALAYARDDSHGYELRERDYDVGTDCAGLARLYAAAVEGVSLSSYPEMHTWDMRSVLKGRGWQVISFSESAMRRGDLLVRENPSGGTGHTVVYLGSRRIVGAEGDWDGRRGDGSGTEICERSYYAYSYKYIVRPPDASGEVEEEVTDADIKKIAHAVWNYMNTNVTDVDTYQRQTDIHNQLERTDTAGHDNPDGHDIYGRINIIEHNLSLVMAALGVEDAYRSHKAGDEAPSFDEEAASIGK